MHGCVRFNKWQKREKTPTWISMWNHVKTDATLWYIFVPVRFALLVCSFFHFFADFFSFEFFFSSVLSECLLTMLFKHIEFRSSFWYSIRDFMACYIIIEFCQYEPCHKWCLLTTKYEIESENNTNIFVAENFFLHMSVEQGAFGFFLFPWNHFFFQNFVLMVDKYENNWTQNEELFSWKLHRFKI